ncbi:PQQ-binding-like beta-propeller repeat protein [Nocardioides sp. NPDC057577]|uniref:outer membrane protein assembly factor BamB family protein n=1 Tax=Nocardioides sp. NPDC057577 TaxID=3346171 RepID=UPI00366CEB48
MTQMPQPTCPRCGTQLAAGVTACPTCGVPRFGPPTPGIHDEPTLVPGSWTPPPPPPAQWAAPGTPPPGFPAPGPKKRTGLWIGLAIGVVLLLVAGIGTAAFLLLRDDEGGELTAGPVTTEPSQEWSWESDKPVAYVYPGPGLNLVKLGGEEPGLVALDEDGKERWRDERHPYNYLNFYEDQKLITASWYVATASSAGSDSDSGDVVFDYDGEVVWENTDPEVGLHGIAEDGDFVVRVGEKLTKLDPESKEEDWSITGQDFAYADDATFALDGDQLTRYAEESGEQEWSTELPPGHAAGLAEEYLLGLRANDDFVLVTSGSLFAFDPKTGKSLWTENVSGDVRSVAGNRYAVSPPYSYDETAGVSVSPTPPFPIYGKEGEAGSLDIVEGGFGWMAVDVVAVDGKEMTLQRSSGGLYDIDGALAEDGYDHVADTLDEGVYTVDGATIGYREWGRDAPEWTLTLDEVDSLATEEEPGQDVEVAAGAGAIFVNDEHTVWLYE